MLWRRCSNVETTSWQRWRATLSQRPKLTLVQLSFSTVPQRCDNVNNDVVTTLSQCRCASWRANLYHHVLIQVNAMPILNVTNSLRWVQTQSTKNLDGRAQQRWTAPRECKDQWKVQNNYQKECTVFICSGTIKIKYKKLFLHLLTLQTWADVIVRLTKIKKDADWKLSPMINC